MVPATFGTTPSTVPVMLPEAGVFLPIVVVPFMAFCVMIGLQWSLKSKGSLSAVVATVGVVGVVGGIVGLCAYKSGTDFQFVGAAIAIIIPRPISRVYRKASKALPSSPHSSE